MNLSATLTPIKAVLAATVIALAMALSAAVAHAAPVNDNFANATVIPAKGTGSTPVQGTNAGATVEAGEATIEQYPGTNTVPNTVWYSWTPERSGRAVAHTCGSQTPMILGVYTTSVTTAPIATSTLGLDGQCGTGTAWHAKVFFNYTAGTNYRIAVDGRDALTGAFSLMLDGPEWGPGSLQSPVVDFGQVATGTLSPTKIVRFFNTSPNPIDIQNLIVSNKYASSEAQDFMIVAETCQQWDIQPDNGCWIKIRFAPEQTGPRLAEVNFHAPRLGSRTSTESSSTAQAVRCRRARRASRVSRASPGPRARGATRARPVRRVLRARRACPAATRSCAASR